ncbi:hypothetical protein GCM10010299_44720 [Streptomyces tanashiensis]|nr:hypothetical protein GCM10010299_44720 [Streptomyces tanashiensis]
MRHRAAITRSTTDTFVLDPSIRADPLKPRGRPIGQNLEAAHAANRKQDPLNRRRWRALLPSIQRAGGGAAVGSIGDEGALSAPRVLDRVG